MSCLKGKVRNNFSAEMFTVIAAFFSNSDRSQIVTVFFGLKSIYPIEKVDIIGAPTVIILSCLHYDNTTYPLK